MAELPIRRQRFETRTGSLGFVPVPPHPEQERSAPVVGAWKRKESPSWMS